MNDDEKCALIVAVVAALAIGIAIAVACMMDWVWKDDAVSQGHAEYYLDAQHKRQWRWKTNCVHDVWKEKP